jgi:predicted CXXCH cytochrome family protein
MFNATKLRTVAAIAVLPLLFGLAGLATAGISATKHNLSVTGSGTVKSTDQTEICVFCHTPHDAIKNDNIPLWNHTLSTTATYGVYTSPTFDATDTADLGGITAATAAVSNLCLSCHDGTVAINSFNNPSNINPTTTMTGVDGSGRLQAGSTNLGTDLKNDHPVNFTYNAALATTDGSLINPVDANGSGLSNGVKLYSGKVQCASCHDPHTSAQGAFLRTSMAASQLCASCHNK